jgi:hypothetical protein
MKRSVNFTPRHFRATGKDILSLCNWLGMSDCEMQVVFRNAPIFVNINGEDTVPATITHGRISYTLGKRNFSADYISSNIHPVESDGEKWYEINDTDLIFR